MIDGRLDNVKMWLRKFSKWNVNRRNTKFGSTALNNAVYIGPNKFELVKFLIEEINASVRCITNSGSHLLSLAAENEDADPKVIRYLLSRQELFDINMKVTSQTIKWKLIRSIARIATQSSISRSDLLRALVEEGGTNPLYHAVKRGDAEIVEILMQHRLVQHASTWC